MLKYKFTYSYDTPKDFYRKYLSVYNGNQRVEHRLKPMEIDLLTEFMSIPYGIDVFSTNTRNEIRKIFNISNSTLSSHLSSLARKGALVKGETRGSYSFPPHLSKLREGIDELEVVFTLNK